MKKRIKRMLFGFFRDEIIEYLKYENSSPFNSNGVIATVNQVPFETVNMSKMIAIDSKKHEHEFYHEMMECKREFANEVINHIHVDTRELLDPYIPIGQRIELKLMVQCKK